MTGEDRTFFVELDFTLRNGHMTWKTHVTAEDENQAAEIAADWFWAQLDYTGDKPLPTVKQCYEDESSATHFTIDHADD